MENSDFIPELPSEMGLECLTRLPSSAHRVASRVCRRWQRLFASIDFYMHRKKLGFTRKIACLVQALPDIEPVAGEKPSAAPANGISLFDPETRDWYRLDPVPGYSTGLPLFCQLCSVDGYLVLMGGWDPNSYSPVKSVFIYEFAGGRWRRGKDMPAERSFFAIGASDRRVYIAGGHDVNKNALRSAWVYNIGSDDWTELARMSLERDECEGVVIGDEFWVVSGYSTENQGGFGSTAEVLDLQSGLWKVAHGAWEPGRCPRSSVRVGSDGLICIGAPGVDIGGSVVLTCSEFRNERKELCLEVEPGKVEWIGLPQEFSGFVQWGCCVEI